MSIKNEAIYAALPSTTRGQPTQLSADSKGERIAYAANKSIFLRSIDHPSISTQYNAHTTSTTVARISPSGFYVASGDAAGTVRVWDSKAPVGETPVTKGEYFIISGRINDIAWDGDSQRIIAVGDGKQRYGHCVTADSGNSVGEISGHSAQVNSVSIRQQRPLRAATVGDDKSLVFYHGAPFKFNTSIRDKHSNFVYGVAFSPDGENLVSVGGDKKIWLYDGKTGEVKGSIGDDGHKGSIFGVSWASDSRKFVTASADRTIKIWDVEANKAIQTWSLGDEGPVSIPDQQVGVVWPAGRADGTIISLSLSGNLNYLSEGNAKPTKTITGLQKSITATSIDNLSASPPALYTGSYDGRLCAWDTSTGVASPISGPSHTNYISGISSSPSTSHPRIYSTSWDDTIRTVDTNTATYIGESIKLSAQPTSLTTTTDGITLVASNQTPTVSLFSASGSPLSETLTLPSPVTSLSSANSTVAIGCSNSSLHLYTLSASSPPHKLATHDRVSPSPLTALAFSPSGTHLAAGDSTGKISAFTISSSSSSIELLTNRWTGHTGRVTCLAWNKEGTHTVSGSLDTNLHVWSVVDPGRRVKVANAHKEGVNGVVWLEGAKVLSAGADASVKVWGVELGK
ncbi:MAG: hypothetical protein Q9160_003680 [Pyrenula sp. 1 TL-2023]